VSTPILTPFTPEQEAQLKRSIADTQARYDAAMAQASQVQTDADPFNLDDLRAEQAAHDAAKTLKSHAQDALSRGFHVFGLQPQKKEPFAGSNGFKDANASSDILSIWDANPTANIGINLGASDLCVLDFDSDIVPSWVNETKTYKVKTARGLHVYFRGARNTTEMFLDGKKIGDIKSQGGYVLANGSVHPDGPIYTVVDDSPIMGLPERINELVRHDSERVNASEDGPPIPRGSHDTELFRIGCMLRNAGMNYEEIRDALINICVRRCENHGSDYVDMCEKKARSACKYPVGQASPMLVFGENPEQAAPAAQASPEDKFVSVGELEEGEVQMLIDGFLPEGTTFLGGLPGEGKTFFALSIARALTTGKPFLGTFPVQKKIPVIYLIPESGGRAFRRRCEKFEIPHDRSMFLCRTVSQGATLPLDDASLLEAVHRLKPVVILDTIIRFSEAEDENAAAQNKKLVDDVIRLRQAGAIAVIGLHHSTKKMRTEGMSLELALRGTGDIAASADAVYGLLRDHLLYNNGAGPNEIEVACLKPRDFEPPLPFRIASTKRPAVSPEPGMLIGMESIIDQQHDFKMVNRGAQAKDMEGRIEQLITDLPSITIKGLAEKTGRSDWEVRKAIQKLGYERKPGGKIGGVAGWAKIDLSEIRVRTEMDDAVVGEADVSFDKVA
jgi:hypothetical protein